MKPPQANFYKQNKVPPPMKKIAQGAEAIIFELKKRTNSKAKSIIIKERFEKKYRISELDKSLRQFRTRRETKILQKLEEAKFPAPLLIESNDKTMTISMSKIEGTKLRDYLLKEKYTKSVGVEIGKRIGQLHNLNIIHQDLTTSNMIKTKNRIVMIDFGLSFFSEKEEDKAVDLFLLERAIESTHWNLRGKILPDIMNGYKIANSQSEAILTRLKQVKERGRNKKKQEKE